MQIMRHKQRGILSLSYVKYINHVLQRFNMLPPNLLEHIWSTFSLIQWLVPSDGGGKEFMTEISYALAIKNFMYTMIYMGQALAMKWELLTYWCQI